MHLAGTACLAFEPVVQGAWRNVEQPGGPGLGVHLALKKRPVSHRGESLTPTPDNRRAAPVRGVSLLRKVGRGTCDAHPCEVSLATR